jgi:hypothetical protein
LISARSASVSPSEVRDFFARRAAEFGLHPDALDARPVLSRGGFVNHSFRVSDGRRALHVKLATSPESRAELERWYGLRHVLERHRAPPVLAHVAIGAASGLVFPVLPGARPPLSDHVLRAVLDCLRGLWSDRSLASRLPRESGVTAATCYLEIYHDRFTEDLREIEAEAPPFLAPRDLERMRAEVVRLREVVESDPAFDRVVTTPVHGDLWLDNIVWADGEAWHIVDWDDLRIGDPAMDVAMLTGPGPRDLAPLKGLAVVEKELDPDIVDRLPLLGRASLLDWVIDPLADWIEAGTVALESLAVVRREKERIHVEALELYRAVYPVA